MWHYGLFDYDPSLGQDFDTWRDELAEKGWRVWCIEGQRTGAWINLDGRRIWRLSLRRWGNK